MVAARCGNYSTATRWWRGVATAVRRRDDGARRARVGTGAVVRRAERSRLLVSCLGRDPATRHSSAVVPNRVVLRRAVLRRANSMPCLGAPFEKFYVRLCWTCVTCFKI